MHANWKSTQFQPSPWGNYKKLPKPRLSLNGQLALKLEGLAKNYEDQQIQDSLQKQKDQWTRMAEQMDTTLREVLSQISQVWLWWGFFYGFSPPLPSLVLVPNTQWVKHSLPLPLQNLRLHHSPSIDEAAQHCKVSTLYPVPPASGHPSSWHSSLVNHSLHLQPGLKCKKSGLFSLAAHFNVKVARGPMLAMEEGSISRGHTTPAHPAGSHPQSQTTRALSFVHLPSSPVKVASWPQW